MTFPSFRTLLELVLTGSTGLAEYKNQQAIDYLNNPSCAMFAQSRLINYPLGQDVKLTRKLKMRCTAFLRI